MSNFTPKLNGQFDWFFQKSYRQSDRLLQKIRKELKKLENEFVSVEKFCQYTSFKYEQVEPFIIG